MKKYIDEIMPTSPKTTMQFSGNVGNSKISEASFRALGLKIPRWFEAEEYEKPSGSTQASLWMSHAGGMDAVHVCDKRACDQCSSHYRSRLLGACVFRNYTNAPGSHSQWKYCAAGGRSQELVPFASMGWTLGVCGAQQYQQGWIQQSPAPWASGVLGGGARSRF